MSVSVCLSPNSSVSLRLGTRDGPILKGAGTRRQIDYLATSKTDFLSFAPCCVLSWLFHEKHDAFQIARWLVKLDYKGVFYGVCQPLPHQGVVIRDMRRAFPKLHFDLMVLPEGEGNQNPYEETLRFNTKSPKKLCGNNEKTLQPA